MSLPWDDAAPLAVLGSGGAKGMGAGSASSPGCCSSLRLSCWGCWFRGARFSSPGTR